LIMEWEATFPFEKHPVVPNRYAYTKDEITSFLIYCKGLGMDVIPLQQSFGHVEYILRHYRYKDLREDQKDYSQVCPMKPELDKALFRDLFAELASVHSSKYIHIGGDETYLLGHCPICSREAARVGKSRLYIDYIKMLCELVIQMGKRPLVWADIALKYPDAIRLLPKETIFVDWNYGWDMNRFGDHEKLLESGYEIWGACSMRSHPDNYFLTDWQKHFQNVHDFIPAARKLGYRGMIMTSWSTSGQYDALHESESAIFDLYAIRHVYPISGFNMLLAAYGHALRAFQPLNIEEFVLNYCLETYGFSSEEAMDFWHALNRTNYEISQGSVLSQAPVPIESLLDSAKTSLKDLQLLQPKKNKLEFDQYRLMATIRVQYLTYESIEAKVNSSQFRKEQIPDLIKQLEALKSEEASTDEWFMQLNKLYFNTAELNHENKWRNLKVNELYDRLARTRE
ncbi:MAG: family 20 glycosylhydrolase, partial [Chitinophagales bacterium]